MLLAKTLTSSTFRLALIAIATFGLIVSAILSYVYLSTSSYVRGRSDRAIMSVGLLVAKIDEATAELKRRGVKFPTEPRQIGDIWYAFAEDPNGARVELLQRPPK